MFFQVRQVRLESACGESFFKKQMREAGGGGGLKSCAVRVHWIGRLPGARQHPLDEMFRAVLAAERSRPGGGGGVSLCSLANNGADMGRALMRLTTEDGSEEMVYDWVARERAAAPEAPVNPSAHLGITIPGQGTGGGGGGEGGRDGGGAGGGGDDVSGSGGPGSPRESPRLEASGDGDEDGLGDESASKGGLTPKTPKTPAGEGAAAATKTGRMPLVSRLQGAGVRGGGGGGGAAGTPRGGGIKTPRGGGVIKKRGAGGGGGAGAKRGGTGALASVASVFLSPFHFAFWLLSVLRALLVHDILRVPRPPPTSPALRASIR